MTTKGNDPLITCIRTVHKITDEVWVAPARVPKLGVGVFGLGV